ncbi:MAG: hypothetical protein M3443_12460, partial [Actinomycetota bacterium]|nr:hypothetical protein [Actinomycetota bacterium]
MDIPVPGLSPSSRLIIGFGLFALSSPSPTGVVTLGSVAQVSTVDGPVRVRRSDGERAAADRHGAGTARVDRD